MAAATGKQKPGDPIAIIGGGNIGSAIARGLVGSGRYRPGQITITRRQVEQLAPLGKQGFQVQTDNRAAIKGAAIVIIAVLPQQLVEVLHEIGPELRPGKHIVISIVSGVKIEELIKQIGQDMPVIRAMPNTAIEIGESMTCLAHQPGSQDALATAVALFGAAGKTLVIAEELMTAATALCACGVAFFLRAIRAASQGGIEIGFHPEQALLMAAQTARGAATLVLSAGDHNHPESEIDKVTSPQGATISGLNQMEHEGFSSAMIKGITTSADMVARLYAGDK